MVEIFNIILSIIILFLCITNRQKTKKSVEIKNNKIVLIDTSILIDGRFLAVAKTGFINYSIRIPRSVIGELQLLADGGDDEKRTRARYGLDIAYSLQDLENLDVKLLQDSTTASEGVDNRLLQLAKEYNGTIMTADYNLNKVAKVEGVEVLNINELVQSVRGSYLPGEKLMIEIIGNGSEKKQGVGHLPDGTMVVVENGESLIGSTVEVEFIRTLQTAAGKMMFAKLSGKKEKRIEKNKVSGRKLPTKIVKKDTKKPISRKAVKNTKKKKSKKTAEDSIIELANKD
ncbi:putative PIN and TRAM-domain containing protein YacL [Candidatus Nanogingivalis gingivitcus]|uniref:PIN and TRAM-domain containing protein YacL n=2 Tax=Candidatus Nanogingivalis gingivitcus TaxID=2171992 RepID=A0ABY0FKC0_9BACT|nr:putative PIN and TRAM-domain containing protein YacL [Candidatus Nanogingivalis gingivitcus]